jgi:hypothetical protein
MKSTSPLALALDPAAILTAQGLTPDPWQEELLLSERRHVLLNCSHQSGKSRAVSALALYTARCRPGSLTLLVSPSLRQSECSRIPLPTPDPSPAARIAAASPRVIDERRF